MLGERELSALNAKADALANLDASAWEEAVDWGTPDFRSLYPPDWRVPTVDSD